MEWCWIYVGRLMKMILSFVDYSVIENDFKNSIKEFHYTQLYKTVHNLYSNLKLI